MPENGFLAEKELMMSPDRGRTWETIPENLKRSVVDRYDAGIAYTDAGLSKVFKAIERLEARGEDTIVVLTSDHGEGLGEHGLEGHAYLFDFNIMVPLIISAPSCGWPAGTRVRKQVRSVDIFPTLLDLVGLPIPEGIDGQSLVEIIRGNAPRQERPGWSYAASSNRGVSLRLGDTKYFFNNTAWQPAFGVEQLYDLSADPHENVNLVGETPDLTVDFRARVTERMIQDAQGLHIKVDNTSGTMLTLELFGSEVASPTRLKAISCQGGGARYVSEPAPGGRIVVSPGTSARLYSETSSEGRLTIHVLGEGSIPQGNWTLGVEDVANELWHASYSEGEGRWRTGVPLSEDENGVMIQVFSLGSSGNRLDSGGLHGEIREQLRALGYVE